MRSGTLKISHDEGELDSFQNTQSKKLVDKSNLAALVKNESEKDVIHYCMSPIFTQLQGKKIYDL